MIHFARICFILWAFLASGCWTKGFLSTAHSFSRKKQFLEHRQEGEVFAREREEGLKLYLEEEERWNLQRLEAFEEHKRTKKDRSELRGLEAYHSFVKERSEQLEEEKARLADHLRQRKAGPRGIPSDLSENEELDLLAKRPRYEIKNRVLYGAKPKDKNTDKTKKSPDKFGPGGSGSMSDSPAMGSGYSPGPSMSEPDFNDFPPPPPSMAPYDDGDFPPPPPPPPFEDGGDGF